MSITRDAPAKINLTLNVGPRRGDGYHTIMSTMQTIALCDTLTITHLPDEPGIRLEISGPESEGVPADSSNLVHKAAVRLQKIAAARQEIGGGQNGLAIALHKRLPSQAGLGGGSSDAAATLKAVNQLFGLNLSGKRLTEIAVSLGADVPFFLFGGTALAEGLGERITPLAPLEPPWPLVIVKPPMGVSTTWAYATLDAIPHRLMNHSLGNDFESVVLSALPEARAIYDMFLAAPERHPETLPLLCGSGSAIFCRTRDNAQADLLAERMELVSIGKVWRTETRGVTE